MQDSPHQPFIKYPKKEALYLLALGAIILLGFLLRIYSIWFGYPLITHPDEPTIVETALRILVTRDLNPHYFNYPSLIFYLQSATSIVTAGFYYIFSGIAPEEIPRISFYLARRAIAAIASAISIGFIGAIGKRLISPATGLIAAGIVAVSPLHIENSALVTTDIWVAIFSSIVLFVSVRIHQAGHLRHYIVAGAFVGLATGSKYTAAASFCAVLAAHFYRCRAQKSTLLKKNILLAALAAAFIFIASTPYSVLDPKTFISHVLSESVHYSTGHAGSQASGNYSYHLYAGAIFSADGLGYLGASLALAGLLLLFYKKENRYLFFVAAFPLALFLLIGSYKVFFVRNIVGAIPALALLSAFSVQAIIKSTFFAKHPKRAVAFITAVFFMLTLPLFNKSFSDVIDKNLPDTRWIAVQWIKENIPPGSKIARENYTPPIETFSDTYDVVQLGFSGLARNPLKIDGTVQYVVLSSDDYARFFDGSDRYKEYIQAYSDYFKNNKLLHTIAPIRGVCAGPVIKIYLNASAEKEVRGNN